MNEVAELRQTNPGIRPVINNVLIEPENQDTTTDGGIVLPDEVANRHAGQALFGRLVAIGPDAWDEFGSARAQSQVGDRVVFSRYAGYQLRGADERQYRMMRDVDIGGTVSEDVALGRKYEHTG